ncbi:MAG: hypothetical protein WKF37_19120 [Bryobacteraceae bacterium]
MIVRLDATVSSNSSKVNDAVKAYVITPVLAGDAIAIPAGAVVHGQVMDAKAALTAEERGSLHLNFSKLQIGKVTMPIKSLVEVDNARESVDDAGRVIGILASETLAAKMEQGIGKLSQKNAVLGDILAAASGAVFQQKPSGEIRYEPGIELKLKLMEPLAALPQQSHTLTPVVDEAELYECRHAVSYAGREACEAFGSDESDVRWNRSAVASRIQVGRLVSRTRAQRPVCDGDGAGSRGDAWI